MIIRKAYKYRIYPTKTQISNMENQFSMCRHLYNMALQERKDYYEKQKVAITYHQQQNNLPFLKKERPWYKGVYSQTLQDVLKRLDKGFQAFFRRIKAGEAPGYPKFRKRGQWNSLTYPQYNSFPAKQLCCQTPGKKFRRYQTLPIALKTVWFDVNALNTRVFARIKFSQLQVNN